MIKFPISQFRGQEIPDYRLKKIKNKKLMPMLAYGRTTKKPGVQNLVLCLFLKDLTLMSKRTSKRK